jgi:hypothetical protein
MSRLSAGWLVLGSGLQPEHILQCDQGNGTVRHMQAGKAEKQPPTHSTGDTAHADSIVLYCTPQEGFKCTCTPAVCWHLCLLRVSHSQRLVFATVGNTHRQSSFAVSLSTMTPRCWQQLATRTLCSSAAAHHHHQHQRICFCCCPAAAAGPLSWPPKGRHLQVLCCCSWTLSFRFQTAAVLLAQVSTP